MSDDTPMSPVERYTLIGWTSIILVSCIIGNTIILLATSRYKAIRLDKTSVVLIKSIAICDLLTGIFAVHPTLASLLYGDWPYGAVSCCVFNYLKVPTFVAAVLLICGLHLSKLHTLLYLPPKRVFLPGSHLIFSHQIKLFFILWPARFARNMDPPVK